MSKIISIIQLGATPLQTKTYFIKRATGHTGWSQKDQSVTTGSYCVEMGSRWIPIIKALPLLPDWARHISMIADMCSPDNTDIHIYQDLVSTHLHIKTVDGNMVKTVPRSCQHIWDMTPITVVMPRETVFLRVGDSGRYIWKKEALEFEELAGQNLKVQAVVMMAAHRFRGKLPETLQEAMVIKCSTAVGYNLEVLYRLQDDSAGIYLPGIKMSIPSSISYEEMTASVPIKF